MRSDIFDLFSYIFDRGQFSDIYVMTKQKKSRIKIWHFYQSPIFQYFMWSSSCLSEFADDYQCQFAIEISNILTLWIVSWLNQSEIPGFSLIQFSHRFHWNQMLTRIDLTLEGPVSTFPFWQKKFIWRPKETFWPQLSFHICLDFKDRRITQTNPVNSRIRFSKSFLDLVLKWLKIILHLKESEERL